MAIHHFRTFPPALSMRPQPNPRPRSLRRPLFTLLIFAASAVTPLAWADDANVPGDDNAMKINLPTDVEHVATVEGISQYTLSNGVDVLLFPDNSKDVVTVNMTVFVGSRHEGYGEAGMAHLLEHMLFKGTPDHPNVPKALNDRGARFNGTTWLDRTNYYETLPATDENLRFALELESDRLINSFVRGEDLESEMTVVRNEFESGENNPIRVLMQRVQSAAFDWHNYGKSTIGNRSDIERVPVVKLRQFYRKYYRPDNVMVIIAGKFDPADALADAEETFGALKIPDTPIDPTYTTEPAQDGERTVVLRRVGDIQHVATAYHIPAGSHPDFAAAQALVNILGDEPSGRLYRGMVKNEIATNVFSLAFGLAEPGILMNIASVNKDKSIESARETLIDLVEQSFRQDPVTQRELDRAVQQLLKARELEASDTDRLAVSLSDWAAQGDWRLYFLFRDNVEALTPESVQEAALRYFTRNNRTTGLFIPSETSDRITIPEKPDVASLVSDYKGRAAMEAGEVFEPTPDNIESRTVRGDLVGGIKYALVPKKTRGDTVNMRLALRFGTEDTLRDRYAAVELLGIVMNRGTKDLSYADLQDELTRLRAEINVSSTAGLLSVSVKTKREFLPEVVSLVGDILKNPKLDAEELEVLRRAIVTGLQQNATEPQSVGPRFVRRALSPFPESHILYVPTVDEEIKRYEDVTIEEIRELHSQFIGNQAGEFVAVGNFDGDELLSMVKSELEDLTSDQPYVRIDRPANTDAPGTYKKLQIDDKANAVYYASQQFDLADTDPEYAALVLGNYILGGGSLSSRLADRVRGQEGLSYGIRSGLSARAKDERVDMTLYAITNPQNEERLKTAIAEELQKVIESGVTQKELDDARDAYLQSLRVARTGDGSIAAEVAGQLFNDRTMEAAMTLEKNLRDTTVESVNAAIRKYIRPDRMVTAIAGDFEKTD